MNAPVKTTQNNKNCEKNQIICSDFVKKLSLFEQFDNVKNIFRLISATHKGIYLP